MVEKKNKKPEIEILPVRDGVIAVDDWYPVFSYDENGEKVWGEWNIPEEDQRKWAMATTLKYATKPLIGFTTTKKDAIESIAIAQEFYENTEDHLLMGIISPLSPLAYDGVMLDSLMEFADKNQSLMIACCSLPGATSPVTIGGTLVVNNAEVLAGIVFAQLYKPGTAVVLKSLPTPHSPIIFLEELSVTR